MTTMILATILSLPSLGAICIDNYEALLRERAPRPLIVWVRTGNVTHQAEAFSYLRNTARLSGTWIRHERASIAVQVAIARNPWKDPGELRDYTVGAGAFVDTPVLRSQIVPRTTLREALQWYLLTDNPDVRNYWGEMLYLAAENRANSCSFWR